MFISRAFAPLRNKELTLYGLRTLMRVFCYYAGALAAATLYVGLEKLLKQTNEGAHA